jgi:ribosomal protein S8E
MDKQIPHRFNIWALANERRAKTNKEEPWAGQNQRHRQQEGSERQENSARQDSQMGTGPQARQQRFSRQDLLYADLGSPSLSVSVLDNSTMLTTLYDHRLPIDIELPGRCTMPNGRTSTCKTKTISSEAVELVYDLKIAGYPFKAPEEIPAGSTIHLDLEQIGNFHGMLTSQNLEGFKLAVDVNCKGMLIAKLSRMAAAIRNNRQDHEALVAKTSIMRIEPSTKNCSFTDHTGTLRKGKIINVSQVDALIKAPVIPPIATHIVFAGPRAYVAEVTRTFEIGFAVKFCTPIPPDEFSDAIKFVDQ